MNKINFYDTNGLLHIDIEKIEGHIFISSITLQELEHIKTSKNKDDEVKYKARKATRFLRENEDKYTCVVVNGDHHKLVESYNLEIDNDNLIIACAYSSQFDENGTPVNEVNFITDDICCYNIAKNFFKLNCSPVNEVEEYKGFKVFEGNTSQINSLMNQYMNNSFNQLGLLYNEYLIINNTDLNETTEYKYKEDWLEPLVLPNSKVIKGMNSQQRCALDLLNNDDIPIKIISGEFGSGKTYLTTRVGVNKVKQGKYSKLMLVRNPQGSGCEVGFLPGTKEEKTEGFFLPIIDALEGGEQELERMKMACQLDTEIPFYMKGRSIPEAFILVDECEDLDTQTFKLIGSRLAKNSIIAFVGDVKQAEKKFKGDNGLRRFIDYAKGNPLVGIVKMDGNVRSEASSVFVDFN